MKNADQNLASLAANAEQAHLDRPRAVGTIMNAAAASCRPDDTLAQCAQQMWEHCCGSVVVVDDADRPIAMVTDRDVAMACYLQGRALGEISVRTAMSTTLYAIHESQSIWAAEGVMRRMGVQRLPVVGDDARLVGVVSIDDIARHVSHCTQEKDALSPESFAATIAALGHTRPSAT